MMKTNSILTDLRIRRRVFNQLISAFMVFCLATSTALALDLSTAKTEGLVGETPSGYLEAVDKTSTDITTLINDINGKRKQKYKTIAEKNNTPLSDIEKLAGQKAINKTKPGNFIKINGNWKKK